MTHDRLPLMSIANDTLGAPYTTDPRDLPLAGKNGDGVQGDLVVFLDDGEVCWDANDEREPVHKVKKGDQMWLYGFLAHQDGTFSHEFGNWTGRVKIETDTSLTCIYQSFDVGYDRPIYDRIRDDISPNYN